MKRARKSACWFFTARSGIRIDRFDVWSEAGDWKEQAQALPAQSHTARCVRKKASARFAGAWGVPNKKSKNAAGGRAVDKNIRKGYFYPLLAADLRITRTWTFLRIIIRGY